MPRCPDCGLAWGGEVQVQVKCLTCRCRPPGAPVPSGLQATPWSNPEPPPLSKPAPQPGAPAPLQAAKTAMEKLGESMKQVGVSVGQSVKPLADAFAGLSHAMGTLPPIVTSGAYDAGTGLHAQDNLDDPARICTCDHWEVDHDRLGCTECDGCDAFVLQAAADAIEEVGSLDADDYHPIRHYVRLKDGRRVRMDDISAAAAVQVRRAKANRPAPVLPTHRRGIHLRGIKEKK